MNDMLNGTILVVRSTVLADVLDAPVSELTVGEDVNFGYHLFDGRTLSVLLV